MAASAFDLLRSAQRKSRPQPPTHLGGVNSSADTTEGSDLLSRADQSLCPLHASQVNVDERTGTWWAVVGSSIHIFPLCGRQWPPLSVHHLPRDASVTSRCVVQLSRPGLSSHGIRESGLSVAAVLTDLRLAVFSERSVDVVRPTGAPLVQVPVFAKVVGPHPSCGVAGVVMVVGTQSGRLFSLFVEQRDQLVAVAGPLWPTTSQGKAGWLMRHVRSWGPGTTAEDSNECPPVHSVESLPPPQGSDALFVALAVTSESLALYAHSKNSTGADLLWILPCAQLLPGQDHRLLAARFWGELSEGLLLLYEGRGGSSHSACTSLAHVSWVAQGVPQREHITEQRGNVVSVVVGPVPRTAGGTGHFISVSRHLFVSCVCEGNRRHVLNTVWHTRQGLEITSCRRLEADVLGVTLHGDARGDHVVMLTPYGLLDSPHEASAENHVDVPTFTSVQEGLRAAQDSCSVGREDRAKIVVAKLFEKYAPGEVLNGIRERTLDIMSGSDASGKKWQGVEPDVITRHLLFDKERDLQQWLGFLVDAGVWTRLGGVTGEVAVRQLTAEACERVSVAVRLLDIGAREPVVLSRTTPEVSTCERIISSLVDYPRSLQLGSTDVVTAVVLVNNIVTAFLNVALERRAQIISRFPRLLPLGECTRLLQSSAPLGLGSGWLVSPEILRSLSDLRHVNVTVCNGPTIGAQALEIVESMRLLCRATVEAACSTCGDLQAAPMSELRHSVLTDLARAELTLPGGPQHAMLLAEEFEDLELLVEMSASRDKARLDGLMAKSEQFRQFALGHFLRFRKLQPLFFQTIQNYNIPSATVEELLAPYPELRWVLEVRGLTAQSPEAEWQVKGDRVRQWASSAAQKERHSIVKRDAFAALAKIAGFAAATGVTDAVDDVACLGRLQKIIMRFHSNGTPAVPSKRPSPSVLPESAEDTAEQLSACVGRALVHCRAELCERQFLDDVACLIRMVEKRFAERGVDFASLLQSVSGVHARDAFVLNSLQLLWVEVVMVDDEIWRKLLMETNEAERDALVSITGFFKMLAWNRDSEAIQSLPRSAELMALCRSCESLRCLAPALRVAEASARALRTCAKGLQQAVGPPAARAPAL